MEVFDFIMGAYENGKFNNIWFSTIKY
jgi:hypothetical protein